MAAAKFPLPHYTVLHFTHLDHVNVVLDALYDLEAAIDEGRTPWSRYTSGALSDARKYTVALEEAQNKFNDILPGPTGLDVQMIEVHSVDSPVADVIRNLGGKKNKK